MRSEQVIRREVKRLNKLRVKPGTPDYQLVMRVRDALWYALGENDAIASAVEHELTGRCSECPRGRTSAL